MSNVGTTSPYDYRPPHDCSSCGRPMEIRDIHATVSPNGLLLPHYHMCSIACLKAWVNELAKDVA